MLYCKMCSTEAHYGYGVKIFTVYSKKYMKAKNFCGFSCTLVFHAYKEKSAPFHRFACAAAVAAFKNGLHIFG